MILVDSSVWIDYFRGTLSGPTYKLNELLGTESIAIGDLIFTEVLQGIQAEKNFRETLKLFRALDFIALGGEGVAIEAARNYRKLRLFGVTVRKTIDTIIATRCILDGYELLHNDRDFDAFEKYLGLRCVAI